jgi:prepilin-type N-terminal cleavage/methylation domain-containing protein
MSLKGFTLMEMMIAVSLMSVVVMAGTMVFYKSLSSSGMNQAQVNITASSNQVLQLIENSIKYQQINGVGTKVRSDCIAASNSSGSVTGSTLLVHDQFGATTFSRDAVNNKVSSNSAVISSPNLEINSLSFDWFCVPGSSDILRVTIKTRDIGLSQLTTYQTFSKDINMYNGN